MDLGITTKANDQPSPVRAPALAAAPDGYVRQPHGGMLRAPWRPGQAGNPTGRTGRYWETVRLAREVSPEAMRKLIRLMDCDDERVAIVAAQAVLQRAWGPPRAVDLSELNRPAMKFDFSALTRAELQLLVKVTRGGAIRPADDAPADAAMTTIDGTAP